MKGRVVFLIRVETGMQEAFLDAYEQIRYLVADGLEGHLVDQVCQSPEDPDQWLITSEWEDLEHFYKWEATEEHRDLVRPLRSRQGRWDSGDRSRRTSRPPRPLSRASTRNGEPSTSTSDHPSVQSLSGPRSQQFLSTPLLRF